MSCPLTVAICRVFGKKSSNANWGLVRAGLVTYFSMGSYQPAFRKRSPSQDVRLMKPSTEHHLHRELLPELVLRKDLPRDLDAGELLELGKRRPNDLVGPVVAVDEEADLLAVEPLPVERALGDDRRRRRGYPEETCTQARDE